MKRASSWQIVLVARFVLAMTPGATSAAGPASGPLWVWGMDGNFELGAPNAACNGGYPCNPTPANVPGLAPVIAAAGGANHSLAVTADGNLWAWGHDDKGQLGYVSTQSCSSLPAPCGQSATQVPGIGGVTAVAGGDSWSLAVKNDGTLWSWGDDAMYELGYGTSHTCSPSGLACSFSAGQHSLFQSQWPVQPTNDCPWPEQCRFGRGRLVSHRGRQE